ncbi:hypothetical protein [Marinobacterium sedimentorum]|uniref:hypothetical protein n=1 Tax=Marinobacterium sedimentorum TaxID=2927804 RepID=UPI0020C69D1D|nr:hypothetical protein [Marinobacterium sedimentorum]MCP8685949.1 hypothetical protein [Marinobacterium sedimentorum]
MGEARCHQQTRMVNKMSNQDYMRQQGANDANQNKGPANNPNWSDQEKKNYDAAYNQKKNNSGNK